MTITGDNIESTIQYSNGCEKQQVLIPIHVEKSKATGLVITKTIPLFSLLPNIIIFLCRGGFTVIKDAKLETPRMQVVTRYALKCFLRKKLQNSGSDSLFTKSMLNRTSSTRCVQKKKTRALLCQAHAMHL
jgi:hypothetical protein